MMSSRWRDCAVAPGRIRKTDVLFSWGLLALCSCLSPIWWLRDWSLRSAGSLFFLFFLFFPFSLLVAFWLLVKAIWRGGGRGRAVVVVVVVVVDNQKDKRVERLTHQCSVLVRK